jgi:predicted cupin superfamily sugar epimerase
MKLRIQENAIRLRLSEKEIIQIQSKQSIVEKLSFGEASELIYSLGSSPSAGRTMQVLVPEKTLSAWAHSEEVSLQSDRSAKISVLIEKDFF